MAEAEAARVAMAALGSASPKLGNHYASGIDRAAHIARDLTKTEQEPLNIVACSESRYITLRNAAGAFIPLELPLGST